MRRAGKRALALAAWIVVLAALAIRPARAQEGVRLPPAARVDGLRFEFQTWCNCGPVNLTMVLSYYGWTHDQQTAAAWLKPTVADKNVAPDDLVAYVAHQTDLPTLRALWRYGGDLDRIKAFIAAGMPVIIESGFQPPEHEWMGHYITVVAYDDAVQTIWVYDSYNGIGRGAGEELSYAEFDAWWRHFNRLMVVVYPQERAAEVIDLLGPLAGLGSAAQIAQERAQAEIAATPGDVWAHFNAGTSATAAGNFTAAAREFDTAFRLGLPFRMLWYQFGPYEAYYLTGRYYDVLRLADETEAITAEVEETKVWRGLALAALGRPADALAQFDAALSFNPNSDFARSVRELVASGGYVPPARLQLPPDSIP
jgi:tetratricopeptide (TPR) repeat protein